MACAISSAIRWSQGLNLHNISIVFSVIIWKAIDVRNRYKDVFQAHQTEDTRLYNLRHREVTALANTADGNWFSEAPKKGEFFVGRPQMRPSMTFGNSSQKENARNSRKSTLKSDSQNPGIFTVQCVCDHPKLIGLSIMRECEGVSTALSIFLSWFKVLPRVSYHDNAFNMSRSITFRCPWVHDVHSCVR